MVLRLVCTSGINASSLWQELYVEATGRGLILQELAVMSVCRILKYTKILDKK